MEAPAQGATDRVVIASAADGNYTVALAAMLQSALSSVEPPRTMSVHLLDMGTESEDRERLGAVCSRHGAHVAWHHARSSALEQLPLTSRMTSATYARLALARLLPADVRKVVWLDADVLVVGALELLWDMGLAAHPLLAVQDPCVPYVSSRYGVNAWQTLGLSREAKYFNAGVMVVDLEHWRKNEVGRRAVEYLDAHGTDSTFWDQEGLNAVLCNRWGELDASWNYCPSFTPREQPETVALEPRIVHFAGTLKPWLLPDPESGARGLFYERLDETPWAGWRPQRTIRSVARGWYEGSRLRDVLYPAEHWCMLSLGRRAERVATRLRGPTVA